MMMMMLVLVLIVMIVKILILILEKFQKRVMGGHSPSLLQNLKSFNGHLSTQFFSSSYKEKEEMIMKMMTISPCGERRYFGVWVLRRFPH